MKIILDQPLCIHEMGSRTMQQDSVVPAMGEANASDRHFMVGEGPLADVYLQKASLTIHSQGITARYIGNCRILQIRPGFDEPVYSSTITTEQTSGSVDQITDVQPGDWFLALTDGMCEFFDVEDIVGIFTRPDWTAERKKDALLDYTSANEDNHSAYLLHVRNVEEDVAEQTEPEEQSEEIEQVEPEPQLKQVVIETDLQNQDIDLKETSTSVFDVSVKSLLIVLAGIYLIALGFGFFKGLLG